MFSRIIDQFVAYVPEHFSPVELLKQLILSGPLISIQYVPDQNIWPRWYLIEILPSQSPMQALHAKVTVIYKLSFLTRHQDDSLISEDLVR